jgi:NAD(P)H dehydrogenase (quinone)
MPKIVTTGANGRLGSAIVEKLLRIRPDSLVAVSVRYPKAARRWTDRGVDVRHGDFDIPGTLPSAFKGADRLLIISTSADNTTRIEQHRRAIAAAREAGVQHVYYTSVLQREGSPFLPVEGHLQTEQDLKQSGIRHTIFRDGQYMENLPMFLRLGFDGHTISLPADGPTSWVALEDLAEGITRVLAGQDDEETSTRILALTGPQAIDFSDVARLATSALRRPVKRTVIESAEFIDRIIEKGMSRPLALVLESGFRSRAGGDVAEVDPLLRKILGRPLRTLEQELPRLLSEIGPNQNARAPVAEMISGNR